MFLCLLAADWALPGCFLFGTYPTSMSYVEKMDAMPAALDEFAGLFPEATDVNCYCWRYHQEGLIDKDGVSSYMVHFRLGDNWHVAHFGSHGEFERLEMSDADFDPLPH